MNNTKEDKKSLIKSILIWLTIGLVSAGFLGSVIYYVHYNNLVTKIKKYKQKEYEEDSKNIVVLPRIFEYQSAKDIIYRLNIQKEIEKNFSIHDYIKNYVSFGDISLRMDKNLDFIFTDAKLKENTNDTILLTVKIVPKNKKFKPKTFENLEVKISNISTNYQNSEVFKKVFNKYKDDLYRLINSDESINDSYYKTEKFKNNIFEWYKKVVNEARPNLFPINEYDIIKEPTTQNWVSYINKDMRNLLTIKFAFKNKTTGLTYSEVYKEYIK
ncbi:hypothetical protein [Mycoplasma phocoenae]|uniref:Uncharacterized protein n=1 Tax=Mycoplasma phocoenae TaxID=754517 RepID=A0A858U4Q9_9MOLU|nr:hypothetical protein [Mycoplasma phocoenae]QJG67031.1 hypothetical protein HGG69_01715 [Mycoplasma phocoenae]